MEFEKALKKLKQGKSVRLVQWYPDVKITCHFPDEYSKMSVPYLYIESRFGLVPWLPTQIELFSPDWKVVGIDDVDDDWNEVEVKTF